MARPRKTKVRKRDYAAEYARRVAGTPRGSLERSRARGHRVPAGETEYRRRVRLYSERHPGASPQQARGHRSAKDLEKALKEGSLVSVLATQRDPKTGRLLRVEIQVIDPDGSERTYILEGRTLTQKRLDQLSGQIDRGGGIVSPLYPIRGLEAKAA